MLAVIPAAGRGTRLRPRTNSRPKGLLQVAGKSILSRCFETVIDLGVSEIVVVVGYRKEQIIEYYGSSYQGCPITYVQQRELRGLGDAVLAAMPCVSSDFIVMNGDNVFTADLSNALERHRASNAVGTLVTEHVSEDVAKQTGVIRVDSAGEPIGVVEKPTDPPGTLVLTGFSVFSPLLFRALQLVRPSERGEIELPDAINLLLQAGQSVDLVRLAGDRWNINTEEDLSQAARALESPE